MASLTPCCEGENERLSWPVISPEYGWLMVTSIPCTWEARPAEPGIPVRLILGVGGSAKVIEKSWTVVLRLPSATVTGT